MGLLEVQDLHLEFGGVVALSDVSLSIQKHQLFAIIGPNGAGKTSLFNCISGVYRPKRGKVVLEGENLVGLPPHKIAAKGVGRSFQNIVVFRQMTVLNNLMLGRYVRMKAGFLSGGIFLGAAAREELEHRRVVEDIIDLLDLGGYRHVPAGDLPYGILKRVELGRALALSPKVLLLDEPTAGMNVEEKEDIVRSILDVLDGTDTTVVLIEHDMGVVMDISHRVAVLDFGVKIAEGTPKEVRSDPRVIQAYLGDEALAVASHGH